MLSALVDWGHGVARHFDYEWLGGRFLGNSSRSNAGTDQGASEEHVSLRGGIFTSVKSLGTQVAKIPDSPGKQQTVFFIQNSRTDSKSLQSLYMVDDSPIDPHLTPMVYPPGSSSYFWQAASFFTGPYFFTVIIVSISINRIRNVAMPRRPSTQRLSAWMRLSLRLPSILLMARTVLLVIVMLSVYPGEDTIRSYLNGWFPKDLSVHVPFFTYVKNWGIKQNFFPLALSEAIDVPKHIVDYSLVNWNIFINVMFCAIAEEFAKAMDEGTMNSVPQMSFNLLTFAHMVHGKAHSLGTCDSPFVALLYGAYLLIVIGELLVLHTMNAVTPPVPYLRFFVTGFFSVSLQALRVFAFKKSIRPFALYLSLEPDTSFWTSHLTDILSEVVIVVTLFFRFLPALIRGEPITRVSIFGHPSQWPDLSDSFSHAMSKYGFTCINDSRIRGFAYELEPVIAYNAAEARPKTVSVPAVELQRGSSIAHVESVPVQATERNLSRWARFQDMAAGFAKEVGIVHVVNNNIDDDDDASDVETPNTGIHPRISDASVFTYTCKYLRIIALGLGGLALAAWRFVYWYIVKTCVVLGLLDHSRLHALWTWIHSSQNLDERMQSPILDAGNTPQSDESEFEDDDNEDDDDDDESDSASDIENDGLDPDASLQYEAALLLRDLNEEPATQEEQQRSHDLPSKLILAHHTSKRVLTRRMMAKQEQPLVSVQQVIDQRRREVIESIAQGNVPDLPEDSGFSMCVVCAVSPRNIICWPCRCLALCDSCREALAQRTAASSHQCPTCRSKVEGFSRIYTP